jgi:histidinol dehydrogenase
MSIQIINNLTAAHAHITRLRSREESALPESIKTRLRAIFGRDISPQDAVAQIVTDVHRNGDHALRDYAQRIDGVALDRFWAEAENLEAAYQAMSPALQDALHLAADRIRSFHEQEPHQSWLNWADEGGALGQMIRPIQRVGVYAPGGKAAYPSSLLMTVIPAQVAGVQDILVTTPPGAEGSGSMPVLAAAYIVGLKRVLLLGGAQAIAAMAYGSESVLRVDKIFGAGNVFVTLAKKLVYGDVGIDGLYGPTETVLIADDTANPTFAAADLLAQAEHDPLATALLITPSEQFAKAVQTEVDRQMQTLERQAIIQESLPGQGAILVVPDIEEALKLANDYAPEHLCLLVKDPWTFVGKIRNAGGVFVGEVSSEALGDYVIGPSHVMPTNGTARFASPLHLRDFLKVTSIFAVSDQTAQRLSSSAQTIARAEGLTAHAAAVAARIL